MAESGYSESLLTIIDIQFDEIINRFSNNIEVVKISNDFKGFIKRYRDTGETSCNGLKPDIQNIIETLKIVPIPLAAKIAQFSKDICRSCMFHNDLCFINIYFIVFKSIEKEKFIGFNDVRPNMRLSF